MTCRYLDTIAALGCALAIGGCGSNPTSAMEQPIIVVQTARAAALPRAAAAVTATDVTSTDDATVAVVASTEVSTPPPVDAIVYADKRADPYHLLDVSME